MDENDNQINLSDLPLGSLELILKENDRLETQKEIEGELNELDELYGILKNHTLGMMKEVDTKDDQGRPTRMHQKPKSPPDMIYIGQQFSNLISLKSSKLSLLKHKNDLGKDRLNRATKIVSDIMKRNDGDTDEDVALNRKTLEILSAMGVRVNTYNRGATENDFDEDIDSEIDKLLDTNNVQTIEISTEADEIKKEEYILEECFLYYDEDQDKVFLLDKESWKVERSHSIKEAGLVLLSNDTYFSELYKLPVEKSSDYEEAEDEEDD